MATIEDIADIIERNSMPEPNSGCWLWLRGLSTTGYAVWMIDKRQWRVSHLALLTRGIHVPPKYDACHRCDNPVCVNPDHLFVGTRKDNMQDAKAKGRMKGPPALLVCSRGHAMSGDNIYVGNDGGRRCRACMEIRWRAAMARQKAARHARGLLPRGGASPNYRR